MPEWSFDEWRDCSVDVRPMQEELQRFIRSYGMEDVTLVLVPSVRDWKVRNGIPEDDAFVQASLLCLQDEPRPHLLTYFQFRILPSAIHVTAVSSRRFRVVSLFASVTHSTYSLRLLRLNPRNVVSAFGFFRSAFMK